MDGWIHPWRILAHPEDEKARYIPSSRVNTSFRPVPRLADGFLCKLMDLVRAERPPMATIERTQYRCWICGKEVSLETCKTDENGYVVHEHCYTLRIQLEGACSRVGLTRSFLTWT